MPSAQMKNIASGRNSTDALRYAEKSRQASLANRPACSDSGILCLPGKKRLESVDQPCVSVECVAALPGFFRFCATRVVLWIDLASRADTSRLTPQSAYLPAHLPGFGICALYPRQCLACP